MQEEIRQINIWQNSSRDIGSELPTERGTDLLKELDGMRASLDVVKNQTDVVHKELLSMQIH